MLVHCNFFIHFAALLLPANLAGCHLMHAHVYACAVGTPTLVELRRRSCYGVSLWFPFSHKLFAICLDTLQLCFILRYNKNCCVDFDNSVRKIATS